MANKKLPVFQVAIEGNSVLPDDRYQINRVGDHHLDPDRGVIHLSLHKKHNSLRCKHKEDLEEIPSFASKAHQLGLGNFTGKLEFVSTTIPGRTFNVILSLGVIRSLT